MKPNSQRYTSLPTSEPTPSTPIADNNDNTTSTLTANIDERHLQYKELPPPPPLEIESEYASTHYYRHQNLNTYYSRPILALLTLLVILIATNTLLLIHLFLRTTSPPQTPSSSANTTMAAGINPSPSPGPDSGSGSGSGPGANAATTGAAKPTPYTFSETPYRLFDNASDLLWQAMDPPNGGFYVASSEVDGARHAFGIAMYHQLHCLMHLRGALGKAAGVLNGDGGDSGGTAAADGNEQKVVVDLVHAGHCLDYIRQGILCAADDTLEPPHIRPHALDFVTGLDITHQCRDARAVRQMSVDSGLVSDGEENDDDD